MRKRKDCTPIFERIAAAHHTTVEEVRRSVEATIRIGFSDPDPEVQAQWARVPCKGNTPTPDELLLYVAQQAKYEDVDMLLRRYFKW